MTHRPTIKIDHAISSEANLNKLKNNKISPQVFSGYSVMKIENILINSLYLIVQYHDSRWKILCNC